MARGRSQVRYDPAGRSIAEIADKVKTGIAF